MKQHPGTQKSVAQLLVQKVMEEMKAKEEEEAAKRTDEENETIASAEEGIRCTKTPIVSAYFIFREERNNLHMGSTK